MAEETEPQSQEIDVPSSSDNQQKRKKTTNPPDGYVCNLCGVAGHWIQQCPDADKESYRQKKKRKKRKSGEDGEKEYQPGVEPSPKDIERAKQLQAIPPPNCDCGITSRLKKVKRSHVTEHSRAIGSYFFFCPKKKDDATKCNFAQPVEDLQKSKKQKVQANFFAKKRKDH